jgi:hypothetical protein
MILDQGQRLSSCAESPSPRRASFQSQVITRRDDNGAELVFQLVLCVFLGAVPRTTPSVGTGRYSDVSLLLC